MQLLGLDLVDGTPVYDLKPYIPWDAISDGSKKSHSSINGSIRNNDCVNDSNGSGNDVAALTSFMEMDEMRLPLQWGSLSGNGEAERSDRQLSSIASSPNTDNKSSSRVTSSPCVSSSSSSRSRSSTEEGVLRVPDWVSDDTSEFASVSWTPEARAEVAAAREQGALGPLYPPLQNMKSKSDPSNGKINSDHASEGSGGDEVCLAISEVIAQDPRAQKDGRGSCTSDPYSLTFATLRVAFEALPPPSPEAKSGSKDSGGESGQSQNSSSSNQFSKGRGRAVVVSVEPDPGDATAPPGSYQHSMFLRRCAETEMKAAAAAKEAEEKASGEDNATSSPPPAAPAKAPSSSSSSSLSRKAVAWAHPIREGVVQGLFALRGGGEWRPQAAATLEWVGYRVGIGASLV